MTAKPNGSSLLQAGRRSGAVIIVCSVLVAGLAAPQFLRMRQPDVLHPGAGVTQTTRLSSYFPALAGGPGDTPVYILNGPEPGGCLLVLGGTHPDEPAGYLTAVVLIEHARVKRAGSS